VLYLHGEGVPADQVPLEVVLWLPAVRTLVPGIGVEQQVHLGRRYPGTFDGLLRGLQRELRRGRLAGHRRTTQLVQLRLVLGITAMRDRPVDTHRLRQAHAQTGDEHLGGTHGSCLLYVRDRPNPPLAASRAAGG
jgi:hypothetical protein